MTIREPFYAGIVLVILGALFTPFNPYAGGWTMTIGGIVIMGVGFWKFLRMFE